MPAKHSYYYDDEPETKHPATSEQEDEGDADSGIGLLPKSILMGKKFNVGDEVVLKITAIHDDQIQVEYATGESDKDEKPEEEPTETPPEGEAEPEPMPEPAAAPAGDAYE